jgi:hypothetical protein
MKLVIDGTPIPLLPRIEAMILLLIKHQRAIELHPSDNLPRECGHVRFDFGATAVEMFSGFKLERKKL